MTPSTSHTIGIDPVTDDIRDRLTPAQAGATRVILGRHDGYITKIWCTDADLMTGWTLESLADVLAGADHAILIPERRPLPAHASTAQILDAAADLIETGRVAGASGTQLGLHALRVALFDTVELRGARQVLDRRYVAARNSMHRELLPREASPLVVVATLRAAAEAAR